MVRKPYKRKRKHNRIFKGRKITDKPDLNYFFILFKNTSLLSNRIITNEIIEIIPINPLLRPFNNSSNIVIHFDNVKIKLMSIIPFLILNLNYKYRCIYIYLL